MADSQSGKRLIFGTMRLHEVDRTAEDWANFFIAMHERGVTKLHSSSEYDSFPLLLNILERLGQKASNLEFQHIVKLAEPSFDDHGFDPKRLNQQIASYCDALRTDHIDDVQWMWRQDLQDDETRIDQFRRQADDIRDAGAQLKSSGRIGRFLCFPYSVEFAETAVESPAIDGLVIYRNTQELGYDSVVSSCGKAGKAAVAIRPFNAGKVLESGGKTARERFDFALDLNPIEAGIVSTSSMDHLEQLVG